MTGIRKTLIPDWTRGVDIAPLVVFRIIFGILGAFSAIRFIYYGWVERLYITPSFHFHYQGFHWINTLPGKWMYVPFILMVFAGLAIALGFLYRFAAILFFLTFSYVELLDKANYLNHYYFVSIISFLLIWIPAHHAWSIDSKRNPAIKSTTVPYWSLWILRFQLTLVYCFAGLAKINSDWLLEAQPLRIWLQTFRDVPVVGNYLADKWVAYLFSWFGCIYDLFVPFFLMIPKTRKPAYLLVIVFHVLTWILFPIGVFPWVMIGSTLIFFPASFHKKILSFFSGNNPSNHLARKKFYISPLKKIFIVLFITVQLVVPMRYALYSGNLFWYESGFRFSWRVMLMEKKGIATFYVVNPKDNASIEIKNSDYLTDGQIDQMSRQPDMILEFAHFLGAKFQDTTFHFGDNTIHLKNPRIEVEGYVTLNGRPNSLYVSRKHDLMKIDQQTDYSYWIEPPKHN